MTLSRQCVEVQIGLYRDFTNRRHRIYRTYYIEFYNRPNTGPVVARSGSGTGELLAQYWLI